MQRRMYDYKCFGCIKIFESLEYSSEMFAKCPNCEYDGEKLISAPAMLKTNFADKTRVPGKKL